jgi:branched-chain amino acid transport system permease protein
MKALSRFLPPWLNGWAVVAFVAGFVALYIAPLVVGFSTYFHNLLGLTFMSVATALAWNWVGGYVGQVSFGHAAMFGVGGFVSAQILSLTPVPFWLAWIAGGIIAAAYALLWGHPTLRLRGPYFAIATIGVGEGTRLIMTYWEQLSGGASGVSLPIQAGVNKYTLYWYGLYLMAAVVVVAYYLRKSRIGLGLLAIKADVDAAGDVGVNATYYQDLVLILSGLVLGISGAFYASFFAFIEPSDMFGFQRSISFVLMAVIGGIGTILGPALGAVIFVIIEELLIASYPDLYLGLYGGLVIVAILFEPLGLSGLILRLATLLGYRPKAQIAGGGVGSALATGLAGAGEGAPPEMVEET